MMYLLFRYHHITPMQYFTMGYGEKSVIRAFMRYEIDSRNKEIESMKGDW